MAPGMTPGGARTSWNREKNPGEMKIEEILNGKVLPRWNATTQRMEPPWTLESMGLMDDLIENTLNELNESGRVHEVWRQENRRWPQENHQKQGFLDRNRIWDRICRTGAVGTLLKLWKLICLKKYFT